MQLGGLRWCLQILIRPLNTLRHRRFSSRWLMTKLTTARKTLSLNDLSWKMSQNTSHTNRTRRSQTYRLTWTSLWWRHRAACRFQVGQNIELFRETRLNCAFAFQWADILTRCFPLATPNRPASCWISSRSKSRISSNWKRNQTFVAWV